MHIPGCPIIATNTVAIYRGCYVCLVGFWDTNHDDAGVCDGCDEPHCEEHIFTSDGWGDDGSGQYVTDLNGMFCDDCIAARHEPLEVE